MTTIDYIGIMCLFWLIYLLGYYVGYSSARKNFIRMCGSCDYWDDPLEEEDEQT